ncbi:MAG: hypothetical protein QHD01_21320 [Bradyrhizobium sp.]|uniref:hypothetical protein n=1 Tax=Bradyrhizobium sp. TaxID=376 RepID=UPI0029A6C52E|nr:hypothetical protein [Bradyrhizobium sp.]MDX3969119.1 hypothetical protein [Bradyrhizobium sp.]
MRFSIAARSAFGAKGFFCAPVRVIQHHFHCKLLALGERLVPSRLFFRMVSILSRLETRVTAVVGN